MTPTFEENDNTLVHQPIMMKMKGLCSSIRFRGITPQKPKLVHAYHHSSQNATRKVFYAFNPLDTPESPRPTSALKFLHQENIPQTPGFQHANPINPSALNVPFPSLMQYSLQSKYWNEAESALREFANEYILKDKHRDGKYVDARIDAAVSFSVNMCPLAGLERMRVLSRANGLLFLHDDAMESENTTSRHKATLPRSQDEPTTDKKRKNPAFAALTQQILAEDPILGQRFLESILSWASLPKTKPHLRFDSFEDFVQYRLQDSGSELILQSVEFASNISPAEDIMDIRPLCAKHFTLINDLYSHAKEAIAEQENGQVMVNAVRVLEDLMDLSVSSAKYILHRIIIDIETKVQGKYEELINSSDKTEAQLLYARALIATMTGNVFYSATCERYARAVPGSRLSD